MKGVTVKLGVSMSSSTVQTFFDSFDVTLDFTQHFQNKKHKLIHSEVTIMKKPTTFLITRSLPFPGSISSVEQA